MADNEQPDRRIQLPFADAAGAERHLAELEAYRAPLNAVAHELVAEFRSKYAKDTSPIYLARLPDKSHTPVRWRLSTLVDTLALRRMKLDTPDIQRLLAISPAAVRRAWLAFE